jgi:hypothetical protein
MLQRNLLYTAVSRARRVVVIVGSMRAIGRAVQNDRRAVRYSGLAARLRGLAPAEPRVTLIDNLDELRAYFGDAGAATDGDAGGGSNGASSAANLV